MANKNLNCFFRKCSFTRIRYLSRCLLISGAIWLIIRGNLEGDNGILMPVKQLDSFGLFYQAGYFIQVFLPVIMALIFLVAAKPLFCQDCTPADAEKNAYSKKLCGIALPIQILSALVIIITLGLLMRAASVDTIMLAVVSYIVMMLSLLIAQIVNWRLLPCPKES